MKKILLVILLALAFNHSYAQNLFPDSGKIGIGTRSPVSPFTIKSPGPVFDASASSSSLLLPLVTLINSTGSVVFELRSVGTARSFALGASAGKSLMTGGADNTFVGSNSGTHNTTGDYNNFFGYNSGVYNSTNGYNNFFGSWVGYNNTTGSYNNFFGSYAGFLNTSASYNTFMGSSSGYNNTTGISNSFFGFQAGNLNTSGSNNNAIGYGG